MVGPPRLETCLVTTVLALNGSFKHARSLFLNCTLIRPTIFSKNLRRPFLSLTYAKSTRGYWNTPSRVKASYPIYKYFSNQRTSHAFAANAFRSKTKACSGGARHGTRSRGNLNGPISWRDSIISLFSFRIPPAGPGRVALSLISPLRGWTFWRLGRFRNRLFTTGWTVRRGIDPASCDCNPWRPPAKKYGGRILFAVAKRHGSAAAFRTIGDCDPKRVSLTGGAPQQNRSTRAAGERVVRKLTWCGGRWL